MIGIYLSYLVCACVYICILYAERAHTGEGVIREDRSEGE